MNLLANKIRDKMYLAKRMQEQVKFDEVLLQRIKSRADIEVECPICLTVMDSPCQLKCAHTLCVYCFK